MIENLLENYEMRSLFYKLEILAKGVKYKARLSSVDHHPSSSPGFWQCAMELL